MKIHGQLKKIDLEMLPHLKKTLKTQSTMIKYKVLHKNSKSSLVLELETNLGEG